MLLSFIVYDVTLASVADQTQEYRKSVKVLSHPGHDNSVSQATGRVSVS